MDKGILQIYYGEGHGKTTAAIGNAMSLAAHGKQAVIIQFLKGINETNQTFFKRLEPEIKYFNFSRNRAWFTALGETEKQEEAINQLNGFHYAKKVISTGACDCIVLDELLGLDNLGIVSFEEIRQALINRPEDMTVICTGRVLDERFRELADEIYNIEVEK